MDKLKLNLNVEDFHNNPTYIKELVDEIISILGVDDNFFIYQRHKESDYNAYRKTLNNNKYYKKYLNKLKLIHTDMNMKDIQYIYLEYLQKAFVQVIERFQRLYDLPTNKIWTSVNDFDEFVKQYYQHYIGLIGLDKYVSTIPGQEDRGKQSVLHTLLANNLLSEIVTSNYKRTNSLIRESTSFDVKLPNSTNNKTGFIRTASSYIPITAESTLLGERGVGGYPIELKIMMDNVAYRSPLHEQVAMIKSGQIAPYETNMLLHHRLEYAMKFLKEKSTKGIYIASHECIMQTLQMLYGNSHMKVSFPNNSLSLYAFVEGQIVSVLEGVRMDIGELPQSVRSIGVEPNRTLV